MSMLKMTYSAVQAQLGFKLINRVMGDIRTSKEGFHDIYSRRGLFPSRNDDVSRCITLEILDVASRMGKSAVEISPFLDIVTYEAFTETAVYEDAWQYAGNDDIVAEMKDWLNDSDVRSKRSKIRQLFNIQGRRSNRYLVYRDGDQPVGMDEIESLTSEASCLSVSYIDAHAVAKKLRGRLPRHLFTLSKSPLTAFASS